MNRHARQAARLDGDTCDHPGCEIHDGSRHHERMGRGHGGGPTRTLSVNDIRDIRMAELATGHSASDPQTSTVELAARYGLARRTIESIRYGRAGSPYAWVDGAAVLDT